MVPLDERIKRAFSGVTNGRLSSLVTKMADTNTIQIPLYPHAENLECLAAAYNHQDGHPEINHTTLSKCAEFARVAAELEKEHGCKVIAASKASDATKIEITLEKR